MHDASRTFRPSRHATFSGVAEVAEVNADVQMTAADVSHAREVLRLTQSQLAAELGTIPDIIAGFETGRVRVPTRIAKQLRWRVALEEQERALEAAGLGPCPDSVALIERFRAPGADLVALSKSFDAHTAACPHCQARERFAQSLPPLPD